MRHTSFFRLLAMMTIWFYCGALAQAGQVITAEDKSWARQAVQQEGELGVISTSNSIAVLYFNNKSGRAKLDPLQKGLAVMLITDLAKVEQIQVVERVRMQALLDEMDLGTSGLVDVKTAPKVGKLLGAYYVTSGDILDGKIRDLEIDSSLLDVPFETVTRQPTAAGALDELFKLEKEILFSIIDQMKVSISPEKKAELEKPLSVSTAALLALFLGLDHSDKGRYAEAANMYEQALIEDPDLELAKNALQELKGMGLTATEEIAAVEEPPSIPPAADDGGSSVGTIVGVGLALAAVGVGVAIASGSSSSDDEGDSTQGPNDTTPDSAPTVTAVSPEANSSVNCYEGSITFSFSESMMQSGEAIIDPADFAQNRYWSGQNYVISWTHGYDYCEYNGPGSISITLTGFQDAAGNALAGTTNFSYQVD